MSQAEAQHTEVSFGQPSVTKTLKIVNTITAKDVVYQIFLQKDEDSRFVATCPDLPGVVTDGADEQEAIENARYAVSDMLDSLGKSNKDFKMSVFILP